MTDDNLTSLAEGGLIGLALLILLLPFILLHWLYKRITAD